MKTIFNKRNITTARLLFFAIINILAISCSKPDDSTTTPTQPPVNPPNTTELILAAGQTKPINGSTNVDRAIVWRNGVGTYLTPVNVPSLAKGFDVLNTATVVCGTTGYGISGPNVTKATLWINTDEKILENNPTEYSEANAVQVANGNQVYTVGYSTVRSSANITYAAATLWKGTTNISKTLLTTQAETNNGAASYAYGIDVNGNDVYVAGVYTAGGPLKAVYWKNGLKIELTQQGTNAEAKAIEVTNGKVYITGYVTINGRKTAALWICNDNDNSFQQEIILESPQYNATESTGLNVFNTGSITYVYGTNSGSMIKNNVFGRQWKIDNSVVINKYFGEEELTTTLCDIYSGHMYTNVSTTGQVSNFAAGNVQLDFLNSSIQTPCFWKNNGIRTNIEPTPLNSGTLIGVRIL